MRLGQLARQLAISPDELVTYLANREIALDSHPNTRLEDKHVEVILQHFAPGNDELRQQVQEQLPDTAEPLEAAPAEDATPPELIKAPKVELPGLRVVGKIDLPEKKKPEPEGLKPEDPAQPEPRPERKPTTPGYQRRNQPPRDRKNPIALQREQEERERRRKLEEAREKDKERRAQYYQKRLKPQAPTKAVRLIREEFEEMPALEPEKPKTAWGRFMRWLKS
jgi:hypothetical protein